MVKICIDAAMTAAKGGSADGHMSVDFGPMMYKISAKRIELIHKKSKAKMAYSVGRQEIIVNNTSPLPDKQCQKFVGWVKKLIDDGPSPRPSRYAHGRRGSMGVGQSSSLRSNGNFNVSSLSKKLNSNTLLFPNVF